MAKHLGQARLPNPRRAFDHRDLSLTGASLAPEIQQLPDLLFSPDERSERRPFASRLETSLGPMLGVDAPGARVNLFDDQGSEISETKRIAYQAPRGVRNDDLVRQRHGLQTGRQVGRLAKGQSIVVGPCGPADHDWPCSDTDAYGERFWRRYVLDRLHDSKGRVHTAFSVILVCGWPAEIDQ
jgi:hypothetical protein